MLNLFDYLTKEDNEKIENYITKYGVSADVYEGNKEYLKYWAESNKKLFHLLGGKLIYEVPYVSEKSDENVDYLVRQLLKKSEFKKISDFLDSKNDNDINVSGYYQFWSPECYKKNSIEIYSEIKYKNKDKGLKFQKGTKILKALQKLLIYLNADDEIMQAFEKFRIDHSMIFNDKVIRGTLCFSIHPLDFMTMSDNSNGWNSCMNWRNKGCYRVGTVEMMNSNNVVCVYLKNDKHNFIFDETKENCEWNNKIWRQLFYCTKEIIVSGKSYPLYNEKITIDALRILRELAFNNWHHSYEFGIEKYKDMIHVGSLYRMENNRIWIRSKKDAKKQNILFDSKAMYNDMLNDNEYNSYWCVRNRVKKNTIISYSGKAPCLCCGEILNKEPYESNPGFYEGAYNDRYRNTDALICSKCEKKYRCDDCGIVTSKLITFENRSYCEECWNNMIKYCPICHKPMDLSCISSRYKCYNIHICNECSKEYLNNIMDKYYTKEVYNYYANYEIKPEEKANDCIHIKKYFEENLENVPIKDFIN